MHTTKGFTGDATGRQGGKGSGMIVVARGHA